MITAFGSIETAIEAIREGAFDYISKPFKLEEIKFTVRRALEQRRLLQENRFYRQELLTKYQFKNVIGQTPQMVQVYKTIAKVADTKSTVLLYGESGTGKELVARSIHYNSPREITVPSSRSTAPRSSKHLLETRALRPCPGRLHRSRHCQKGPVRRGGRRDALSRRSGQPQPSMQTKLLRFLQEHEIKRVGGTESVKVDVRVIAATNQPLEPLVKEGKFREDLFYRLNVVTITLPPLKREERGYPLCSPIIFCRNFLKRT